MTPLSELELAVHTCTKSKESDLKQVIKHYPLYSFGALENKPLLVVALNPSTVEYEKKYVSESPDPAVRQQSQINYFNRPYYGFFTKLEKFFQNEAKQALNWQKTPWEKVGFTDLAKCPTRNSKGQWTQLTPSQKRRIINNCQGFLIEQIKQAKPKAILAYGTDACKWFYPGYTLDDAYATVQNQPIILVPQRQGGYPNQIIEIVQQEITKIFTKP
jgi:hypothetical protein